MSLAVLEQEVSTHAPASRGTDGWKRSTIFCLVLAAFLVRIAFLLAFQTYARDRVGDIRIAGETTNVATSIAWGHGFSSVFNGDPTGPTAVIAPGYPYFVAFVFRLLGAMTRSSIICILVSQSLFSALTVIPILRIASRSVGGRAGLWAAWTWALFPWFGKWSVTWVWDTSLSALLLACLFWYALKLLEASTGKSWIGFGALWGLTLLVNPSLGTFLPVSLGWCGYELQRRKKAWLRPAAFSMLTCLIVISPWLVRNRVVFGRWVFLRSNFGFEFAMGNYHGSLGRGWGGTHPSSNPKEFYKYWQMGEIAYFRSREEQAVEFAKEYPREFITLTAKRVAYFWDGSAMDYFSKIAPYWLPSSYAAVSFLLLPALLIAHRRSLYAWHMFFGALFLYPLPYYLTFSEVRFRHAIEPIILLLIAYAGVESASKISSCFRPAGKSAPEASDSPRS